MTSKQNILSEIRKHGRQPIEMPSFETLSPVRYEDCLEQFVVTARQVGGRVALLEEGTDINALIRSFYPEASVIASSLPFVEAALDPDTVADARELNGTDVGVVKGEVAVAENGCVWVPQTMKERAVLFISECLVIIVDRKDIVNNMHEAYSRIDNPGYGCFISGPSKTADIAQALVMGAQAARDVLYVIV